MEVFRSIITVNLNTAIDRVLEVPGLALGAHLAGRRLSRYPAGKGINVTRALATLGRASVATGFVGEGELQAFEEFLDETSHRKAVCQLLSVRGRTRENITLIDPEAHTDIHVREEGYEVTRRDLVRMRSKIGLLARPGTLVIFSGSIPQGMTAEDMRPLIHAASVGGAALALDLGGELARQTIEELTAPASASPPQGSWLIKPNAQELVEMLGVPATNDRHKLLDLVRGLLDRVTWVALTLGAEGAMLISRQGAWSGRLPIPAEAGGTALHTVGCGDSMLAGLVDAAADGSEPADMLRHGLACATANTLVPGAATFDPDQVRKFEPLAQIEKLS
ncbi:MAG: hypothetical protein IT442_06125 [Phycisphaeraceae bacterium]|nr:hypothetical protein [Phycisphaeraceae bacterium]